MINMWQDMYNRTAGHILISECELDGSEGDGGAAAHSTNALFSVDGVLLLMCV